ncbi:hypothetical protein M1O54_00020 [Dehalococcoidia bacterium]|nr:hypothetical protein [Dehalococcoidia bacterium]
MKRICKDKKEDEFYLFTPEEKEELVKIVHLGEKALKLYELTRELMERAKVAGEIGNRQEFMDMYKKALECRLLATNTALEGVEKQIEFYRGIARVEGWEISSEEAMVEDKDGSNQA